ncbi:MAG: hypothetical protein ABSE46_19690 [Terracidiphilus sp.]|jgi:transposase
MADVQASISDLQSKWDDLSDLERGRAIQAIHRAGASLRQLAKAVNRSLTLIRHLHQAAQAPAGAQYLARQGNVSTRELVRRAKAAGIREDARHREAIEMGRTNAARASSKKICDWLASEKIPGSCGEQIVAEARRQIALTELKRKLPTHPAPPGMAVDQIIQRCKPPDPSLDEFTSIAWFGTWLALWTFYAFTDSQVRDAAIDLALEQQSRR